MSILGPPVAIAMLSIGCQPAVAESEGDPSAGADAIDAATAADVPVNHDGLAAPSDASHDGALTTDAAVKWSPRPGPKWVKLGDVPLDKNGRSLPVSVTTTSSDRYLAVRVRPAVAAPGAPWCFGIDSVVLPDGTAWLDKLADGIGASSHPFGSQRALPQHGYGVFVLPNDGVSELPNGKVRFQVVLRDCRFDLPTKRVAGANRRGRYASLPKSVVVEAAREPALNNDAKLRLVIRVAVADTSGHPAQLGADSSWQAAMTRARALFSTAKIDLVVGRIASFKAPKSVNYGPGQRTQLDAVYNDAMSALTDGEADRAARFVPAILVRCLLRNDPLTAKPISFAGQTARIPGGAPFGPSASGVFIAREHCSGAASPLVGEKLGAMLAHELGHHLGLHHTDDTLGSHRASKGYADVMNITAGPSKAKGFTSKQRVALRRHFAVYAP